jgi:tetratricopeptide (TPR) repeat protein
MKKNTTLATIASSILVLAACGGAAHPTALTIDTLRQRAAERPHDPAAQRALAEGELLLHGGDPARADATIQRALALSPDDLGLLFLHAIERELHGHPADALEGYLDVIRRAASSEDPLAPAMAEIAAAEVESLDDGVPGFVTHVQEELTPILASPGNIGDGARSTIADVLIDIAYRRGDVEGARALTEAQGCPLRWRVAGPIGPRHLIGFDRELAPEHDETLGDRYDYGPGRGEQATRDVEARGCSVHLGNGPVGGAGTTYAETTIEAPAAGRYVLRVETPNAAEVFVDGRSIARLDRRREPLGRVSFHAIELTAGAHHVRVKVSTRHPNPVLALSVSRTAGAPGGGDVEGESLIADHVRIQRAMSRGEIVAARQRLQAHLVEDGSPVFLVIGAAASLTDPLRTSEVRHDTARRLLGWAADRDSNAWYPRLTLAQLEANEGRDVAAIGALRRAAEHWPELVVFPLQLVDLLEQRGWHAQADEMIAHAASVVPDACRPKRAALSQARRRHRATDEMEIAQALVECDARSDAMVTTYLRRREWDRASEELTRLASLEPEQNPVGVISAQLRVAQRRGDDAAVLRLARELEARMPQSDGPVLLEVDRALARGDEQAARERIQRALTSEPEAMMDLRRMLRAIGGDSPLERFRRDGAQVIHDFEASGRTYEEPMVLVLDYTVYRLFQDGSTLELTHNIFRLQSQEAVDAMGEFHVPEDAHMLTLQTVKQDGRRLEPDEIAGKESISFPNLAPGDYIEFEYIRPHGAPAGYPGGVVGDRFYFRNYETPFDQSQLTVVTPPGVELVVDPRGDAPETEERDEDGLHVYHWGVHESRPLVHEPASVASREFFPSINWGRGATWEMYVESLRDVLADRDVHDPAAAALVAQILGEDAARSTIEQRSQRIYRWVAENIEDTEDVFGLAPAMVAARTGNRTRVLRYLLEMAGVDAELALVRSYTADSHRSDLPDDDTYQNLLVRVRGTNGPLWLHAGTRGEPFGYMPPVLAGMDALMLNEGAERTQVPDRALEDDLRTVEVDLELKRDGGARLSVVETFHGSGAVLWREQLEHVPEARLEQQFESAYVASLVPGGRQTRHTISGREDPEQPLVLRYDVDVDQLARRGRGGWVIPPLYRASLGPQFAPIASRTTTELIAAGLAVDLTMHVRVPEGATIGSTPRGGTLESVHGAQVTLSTEPEDGGLLVRRSFRIPRMRVEPAEYGRFAAFCRASDEAESAEIPVRM